MTFLHENHKPRDVSSSLSFATCVSLLGVTFFTFHVPALHSESARSLVQRGHSHPSLYFCVCLVEVLLTEFPVCEETAVSGRREALWL